MASVRLEMAFIWSSELAERPLAASARRKLSCHDVCAFGLSCGRKFSKTKKQLACIDTLGIRKPAKAAYLRTKSIIQLSKERRAISETHRCSVVTLLSRSTPT